MTWSDLGKTNMQTDGMRNVVVVDMIWSHYKENSLAKAVDSRSDTITGWNTACIKIEAVKDNMDLGELLGGSPTVET